jgi:hydrogenase expression/formation protein HypD
MSTLDELRDPVLARALLERIAEATTRSWSIMEVCGGQTHSILRYGLDELLPEGIRLVHGPGCPVCVTPAAMIERAVELALEPGITLCSFGDMLRVPASGRDLAGARAEGGDVRVVYSPLDALEIARREPDRQVVFFAVGFETTAPANAMAVHLAAQQGLSNFTMLVSHVLVPPAIEAIAAEEPSGIDGFLAAGHVCTVMGTGEYRPLAAELSVPIIVTGFEPLELLEGIRRCVVQLESGRAELENAYGRVVHDEGNPAARALIDEVFERCDREWRGIGVIPGSGLRLRGHLASFDATGRFGPGGPSSEDAGACRAGEVLRGRIRPDECDCFSTSCTPQSPLGAPMVSSEGACAAWFNYRRRSSGD